MRHALSRRGQWADYLNIQNCRITTESGVPVSTSDKTAQGNLYLTPANGNLITLPTGIKNSWVTIPFTETLLGLTITSGKNYDAFAYLLGNSGFGYDLGPAWTDDTTRATGVELFNGYYVNSSSFVGTILGKTIPVRRGLLVGTIRGSGANTTEDSLIKRFVWNKYQQVGRLLSKSSTVSHAYASTTARSWNNDATNQVEFVVGDTQTETINLFGDVDLGGSYNTAIGAVYAVIDWTSGYGAADDAQMAWGNARVSSALSAVKQITLGYHYIRAVEADFNASVTFPQFAITSKFQM